MQRRQLILGGFAAATVSVSAPGALADIPAMSPVVAGGVRPPPGVRKF